MQPPEQYRSDTGFFALLSLASAAFAALGIWGAALVIERHGPMHTGWRLAEALLFGIGFGVWSVNLARRIWNPDRLVLGEEGLTFISRGKTRFWRWSDIARAYIGGGIAAVLLLRLARQDGRQALPVVLGYFWKVNSDSDQAGVWLIAKAINRRLTPTPP